MRADFVPSSRSRVIVTSLAVLTLAGLAGCKTKESADDPTILGIPPAKAYLGVEYYYNFGAYGGEHILDYSLTNAPSWLGLEDTSNKAREGIIIRGVPGITGGQRGDADLGKTENITLLATDSSNVGLQPFDIDVASNKLTLASVDIVEGTADSDTYNSGADYACDLPVMDGTGENTYPVNNYDENGTLVSTSDRKSGTKPVLVRLELDQPSVTTIKVAFELRSEFNPDLCAAGITPPHQLCEYGPQNSSRAILGQDIVGWGNGSSGDLPTPDYIVYQQEGGFFNKGVITLEPGITECYIRLEVIDDTVAEGVEAFSLALTEVREGLASFGDSATEFDVRLDIKDNEPTASLETEFGLTRDAINVPVMAPADNPEYVVRLDGERDGTFHVRLGTGDDTSAEEGIDYEIQVPDGSGGWRADKDLTFPDGLDEAVFRVITLNTFANSLENDKFVEIVIDEDYQAGREGFAAGSESLLHIGINELVASLEVGSDAGFVPTDMVIGHDGRIFVAGYDSVSGEVAINIWDRLGNPSLAPIVLPTAPVAGDATPVLSYREESDDSINWERRLVVSWGSNGVLSGATNEGGIDLITVLLRFDSAAVPEGYVEIWQHQSGTSGDDKPRWIGVDSHDTVFITGETTGTWEAQVSGGGVDSFVQRIDSTQDGAGATPAVLWTRQAGSGLDEDVIGGDLANNGAMAAGNTRGSVNGESQFGGTDFYFYTAANKGLDLSIRQRGTEGDDTLTASVTEKSNVWVLGNSDGLYSAQPVLDDDGNETVAVELARTNGSSQAGFLLSYNLSGGFIGAETLNDADDASTETFAALMRFDEGLIAAGQSNGSFGDDASNPSGNIQPVLVRIAPDGVPGQDDSTVLWTTQPAEDGYRVIRLAEYRSDEIVALVENGSVGNRKWSLVLFSGDGRQLNEVSP